MTMFNEGTDTAMIASLRAELEATRDEIRKSDASIDALTARVERAESKHDAHRLALGALLATTTAVTAADEELRARIRDLLRGVSDGRSRETGAGS